MTGGLRLTRREIFNTANGDRSDVPDVLVLITDGNATREVELLDDEVRRIKSSRIRIVGVGVTDAVSEYDRFYLPSFADNVRRNLTY